jgi:hypothetical protein
MQISIINIENQYFGNAERHLGNAERIQALQNWHFSNANQHLIIENQYFSYAERHLGNAEPIQALQNWHYSYANQHFSNANPEVLDLMVFDQTVFSVLSLHLLLFSPKQITGF